MSNRRFLLIMCVTALAFSVLHAPASATRSARALPVRTAPPLPAAAVSTPPCVGDCDGSGAVTVDEILAMVNIALGATGVAACPAADADQNGTVVIDEVLTAVNHALSGCPDSVDQQGCLSSGGTVTTASCCAGAPAFPDTCTIGSCGCSPQNSVQVDSCSCGANQCFDRAQHACVAQLCRAAAITKGPWVMRVDETHATVLWESRDSGCVQISVVPEAGGQEIVKTGEATSTTVTTGYESPFAPTMYPPDETGVFYVNEVPIADLAPGTCYVYRINAPTSATGRLCTMQPPGQPVHFLAIGDTNPALGKTVPLIDTALAQFQPDFIVHVGDIQYYESYIETWQYWFGAMEPLLQAGAFLPCIGNHEFELDGAEFPDYYARLFASPGLIGTPLYYRFSSGGVHFFSFDTEASYDAGSEQYAWLAHELAAVTSEPGFRFSVVYFHRPVYTLGDSDPKLDLRNLLAPLFQANGVRLVLQGHMHGYERFEVGDITYITTAGGGALIGDVNANVPNYPDDVPLRVAAAARPNLLLVTIGETLQGVTIGRTGDIIDQFEHPVP
jgi:hypothetical protein